MYSNVGTEGKVVMAPGDSGAPSRGAYSGNTGEEAFVQMLRNQSLGDYRSPADYYEQEARLKVARAMADDPLYLERAKSQAAADAYGAKAEARYVPFDRAADGELDQDLAELDSIRDGEQTPEGPMTAALRSQKRKNLMDRNFQLKLEVRNRGTARAPSSTEAMAEG
jgi:hypothetical protein